MALLDSPRGVSRFGLLALFAVLLAVFAVALWGTVVRPPAYEVRGVLVARPTPGMILVRHDAVAALDMRAMDLMAVAGDARMIDGAAVVPGDRVRLGVRRSDGDLVLIRIERLR